MRTTTLRLVTIVAEPVLEERIVADLHRLGATGHTIADIRGAGSRGIRASDPPGAGIRVEVVVSPEVADAVLEHVADHYFQHYAVVAWVGDVQVIRGGKYGS